MKMPGSGWIEVGLLNNAVVGGVVICYTVG